MSILIDSPQFEWIYSINGLIINTLTIDSFPNDKFFDKLFMEISFGLFFNKIL